MVTVRIIWDGDAVIGDGDAVIGNGDTESEAMLPGRESAGGWLSFAERFPARDARQTGTTVFHMKAADTVPFGAEGLTSFAGGSAVAALAMPDSGDDSS